METDTDTDDRVPEMEDSPYTPTGPVTIGELWARVSELEHKVHRQDKELLALGLYVVFGFVVLTITKGN
jgi:hypothetical protein